MKRFLPVLISLMLLIPLWACERADILGLASGPVIFAFADDGASIFFVKASDSYCREYMTSGLSLATIPDLVHSTGSNEFIAAKSGTMEAFYLSKKENSIYYWNFYSSPYTINGLSSRNGERYVLTNTWSDAVYRYGSGAMESAGISLPSSTFPPIVVSEAASDSKVYIYGKSGGTGSVFDMDDPVTQLGLSTGPGETAVYVSKINGEIYLGTNNYIYSLSGGQLNSTSLGGFAQSYTVIDSSNIFVGTSDGADIQIQKLEGSDFTAEQTIISGTGTVILKKYSNDIIAVGINGATPSTEDGLYLYYFKTKTLKKIYSRSVYSIDVR